MINYSTIKYIGIIIDVASVLVVLNLISIIGVIVGILIDFKQLKKTGTSIAKLYSECKIMFIPVLGQLLVIVGIAIFIIEFFITNYDNFSFKNFKLKIKNFSLKKLLEKQMTPRKVWQDGVCSGG